MTFEELFAASQSDFDSFRKMVAQHVTSHLKACLNLFERMVA